MEKGREGSNLQYARFGFVFAGFDVLTRTVFASLAVPPYSIGFFIYALLSGDLKIEV